MALPGLLFVVAGYAILRMPHISKKVLDSMRMLVQKAERNNFTSVSDKKTESLKGFGNAMTRDEANKLLGICNGHVTPVEIKRKHRELIAKNHLDAGGSEYLTYKINDARDFLLAKESE